MARPADDAAQREGQVARMALSAGRCVFSLYNLGFLPPSCVFWFCDRPRRAMRGAALSVSGSDRPRCKCEITRRATGWLLSGTDSMRSRVYLKICSSVSTPGRHFPYRHLACNIN